MLPKLCPSCIEAHACVPVCVLSCPAPFCSASGQSSQERKKGLISKLIVSSKGSEPGYIIRSLQVRQSCLLQYLASSFWTVYVKAHRLQKPVRRAV
jgi:hypothetical protein